MSSQPVRPRTSGVLLHPTCLPGPFGIGDIGPASYQWIDQLALARQKWWQILPVGPAGAGDSPYQSYSAFAGNVALISPELLVRDGLIRQEDLAGHSFPADHVDFENVNPFKTALLRAAWESFKAGKAHWMRDPFEAFRYAKRDWLEDYATFMALHDAHQGTPWHSWPPELLRHDPQNKIFASARQEQSDDIEFYQFGQYLFSRQWQALRDHARGKGISLFGDIPIFVSPDSADVWANPKLFLLDESLRPKVVAGVPPDYFSPTGQLWGNPLYDWAVMKEDHYSWWVRRLKATLELVDIVRLDHFRGFAAAWNVPVQEQTALNGRWVPGPGAELLSALRDQLGGLPIVAEDLGDITPDVNKLRDDFQLPGMKVLQFAFDEPKNAFLPHNYEGSNWVVYTGTHDNDTTRSWLATTSDHTRWFLGRYLGHEVRDVAWDLIRLAWGSTAATAIVPLQDILDLGGEARMNRPGLAKGNWRWRFLPGALTDQHINRLADLTDVYRRMAGGG